MHCDRSGRIPLRKVVHQVWPSTLAISTKHTSREVTVVLNGISMGLVWSQYGFSIESVWIQYGASMKPVCSQYKVRMGSVWNWESVSNQYEVSMKSV